MVTRLGLTDLPEYELPPNVVARLQALPGLPGHELPHTVVARLQASTGLPGYELPHIVVAGLQASPGLPEFRVKYTNPYFTYYCGKSPDEMSCALFKIHFLW